MAAFAGSGGKDAFAVHDDNLFELGQTEAATDILGNGSAADGPDWADLFNADTSLKNSNGTGPPDAGEIYGGEATFVDDDLAVAGATDKTTFASSNKNNHLIETWNWATGNAPVKNDLSNVYAFAKKNNLGELIVYAATERLSPNGDTHVDIEFNQNEIALDKEPECADDQSDGASDGPPCEFVNEKSTNDIIVSLDYTKGGDLGALEVRRWNGTDYVEVHQLGNVGCNDAFTLNGQNKPADIICGFTNSGTIDGGPWPNYDDKGDVVTELQPNMFAEFGINITQVLGTTPCFATVNAHTRTSQSFTAELTDFALGSFELCRPSTSLTMSASPTNFYAGGNVTFTFQETNDGNQPLTKPVGQEYVTIDGPNTTISGCTPAYVFGSNSDGLPSDATHNVGDANNNDILDPGEVWTYSCTVQPGDSGTIAALGHGMLAGLAADPVDVTYCGNETTSGLGTGANAGKFCDPDENASASVTRIAPSTTLLKKASASITYTFEETNDGNIALNQPNATGGPTHATDNGGWVVDDKCSPVVHVLGSASDALASDTTHNVGDVGNGTTGANDNVLDPGETWRFSCTATLNGPTSGTQSSVKNVAVAHGKVPASFDANTPDVSSVTSGGALCTSSTATLRCTPTERDVVTVTIDYGTHETP